MSEFNTMAAEWIQYYGRPLDFRSQSVVSSV